MTNIDNDGESQQTNTLILFLVTKDIINTDLGGD